MRQNIHARVAEFIQNPLESFDKYSEEDLFMSLEYYLILSVFFSLLSSVTTVFGMNSIATMFFNIQTEEMVLWMALPVTFTAILLVLISGLFLSGIFLHIFVIITGGKRGYVRTVKSIIFASTPALIFGWVPVAGIVAFIWSFILAIFSTRKLQEISTARAVLALIIPMTVLLIIIASLSGVYIYTYYLE
ncbi:hypothetical protein F1737_10865 [Methanoplanus sp. FWC-SCC4]|uniref:Yip1 domain-containing protein n=1 Tax=Methanochimaera problematica TaxID=2609417 RepID=A0AA97I3X4_9EURY|nr:YIP1 family protein [Methanoplanus sp. FWC-SCC4]WOF17143.1 hypothetical protein F1737_10865 [Methanoplanus sp. FWC-SCC4]